MTRVTGYTVTAEDWNDFAQPEYVTSLPASPDDGEEVYFEAAAGVIWHLRYNASSASSYKWEFVGGAPLTHEVVTQETTTSTTFADLATVGPDITLPLAGDYEIVFGAQIKSTAGSAICAPKLGAAATADDDGIVNATPNDYVHASRTIRRNGLAASAVIKLQYRTSAAGTCTGLRRELSIRPIRLG